MIKLKTYMNYIKRTNKKKSYKKWFVFCQVALVIQQKQSHPEGQLASIGGNRTLLHRKSSKNTFAEFVFNYGGTTVKSYALDWDICMGYGQWVLFWATNYWGLLLTLVEGCCVCVLCSKLQFLSVCKTPA